MNISFEIPIIPRPQMRARSFILNGHARVHKDSKQQRGELQIMPFIAQNVPENPIDKPMLLTVFAYLPIPTSWPKWKQLAAQEQRIYPTGKPDSDNLMKNIKDCLTQCNMWRNDSPVISETIHKRYSINPRWNICISTVNQPTTKAEYEAM